MSEQAVLEVTFRLPIEILERVNDSAYDRHQAPDQVVAEALGYALPPARARIAQRVRNDVERLSALSDRQLSSIAETQPSKLDAARISQLLQSDRGPGLSEQDKVELNLLQSKIVQIAADRALAVKILRDRQARLIRDT